MTAFDDLLISSKEIDQELVAGVLKPLLRIDRDTRAIRPQAAWGQVSNDARILAYLLARKAMIALSLPLEREAATPSEVTAATGIPSGSVNPSLKGLYERRPQLVGKDNASRYLVPSWAVDNACDFIKSRIKP